MRNTKAVFLVLMMLCLTGTALAKDYWGGPPAENWHRGDPGSTFQHWDFNDPGVMIPEVVDNPYGMPVADFMPPLPGWEYGEWECPVELDPSGFVTGWHCNDPAGGSITLNIPNTDIPGGRKSIFMQVTSTKGYTATVSGTGGNPGGYGTGTWQTGKPQIQWLGPAPFNGVWYTYNEGLWIIPNPQMETITLTFPYCAVVDQIVVDTICSPDPVPTAESSWSRLKALFR